jgi:hypothetical protein
LPEAISRKWFLNLSRKSKFKVTNNAVQIFSGKCFRICLSISKINQIGKWHGALPSGILPHGTLPRGVLPPDDCCPDSGVRGTNAGGTVAGLLSRNELL